MGTKTEPRAAAFDGAAFDKKGFCLQHPTCQLVDPIKIDGRIAFEELRRNCPKCISDKNKSKRGTSLSGGKVRQTHHIHGTSGESGRQTSSRSAKPQKEYDCPFDDKGRCHYHKNVQLAAKKSSGGWKILHKACPRCMEEDPDDDRSVRSGSSRRSAGSKRSVKSSGGPANAQGQFDMNGCCVLHSHVQVAKKKMVGGWKVLRACPACNGEEVGLDDDAISVSSKNSRKSTRSTRSAKSGKSKKGQATKSGRYGNLPFDGDGYCCRHPSVQIATKKLLGGWKIIHDVCPDCAEEMGVKPSRKPSRRKSGRIVDPNGSDSSSIKSGKSASSRGKKKTTKVKNFRTEDENGYAGDYTGEVNAEYKPHGNGIMRYFDGNTFEGVWHEGSQVHGKARRRKSKF
mmetsp:Transcript_22841/g.45632  ORF Transcript_22841/g.45632 Transcript_22841/m.45632 type:complete len:399 (-) Transcript_22841:237-1433(-)